MGDMLLQSVDARTLRAHGEALQATDAEQLEAAVHEADDAFRTWRGSDGVTRAGLLRALADALEARREALVDVADVESALGRARLLGEIERTAFQLRRFAALAESGVPFAVVDDPAVAGPPPAGHPSMQRVRLPLGVVAMFAASNFPFAFSVLGGDTASALAAGCAVVVKAHPAHPRTSRLVFELAGAVLRARGAPPGLLRMVQGAGNELGVTLVRHPRVAAAAFTGSTRGGLALQQAAQARARPIPFFGELGSINPVVATPRAVAAGGEALAAALASSITLGCGQFCTNPGLLVLERDPRSEAFVRQLLAALAAQRPHPMLTQGMRSAFDHGVAAQAAAGARVLLHAAGEGIAPPPHLAEVEASVFLATPALREEVFGPASLIVWADGPQQTLDVLHCVGGALTVTLWGADEDSEASRRLVRAAMEVAGRVLFDGVPTGVAVSSAQQHGGPWPSSTQPWSTSVGDAAIDRFLRPVALQEQPRWLQARQGVPC